jgi:hypothetical protein
VGKPVLVTPAHCKKENVLITPAYVGKIEKKNGHDNSRPLQKGKWPL